MRARGAHPRRLSRAVPDADCVALVRRRAAGCRDALLSRQRASWEPQQAAMPTQKPQQQRRRAGPDGAREQAYGGTTRQAYALEYRNSAVAIQRRAGGEAGGEPRRRRRKHRPKSSIRGDAVFARRAVHGAPDQVHHALAAVGQHIKRLQMTALQHGKARQSSAGACARPRLTRRVAQVQVEHVAAARSGRWRSAAERWRAESPTSTPSAVQCRGYAANAPAPHAVGRLVARVVAGAGVGDLHDDGLAPRVAAGGGPASEAAVVQPAGGAVHAHDLVALPALVGVARAGARRRRDVLWPLDLHHATSGVQRRADGVAAAVVRRSAACGCNGGAAGECRAKRDAHPSLDADAPAEVGDATPQGALRPRRQCMPADAARGRCALRRSGAARVLCDAMPRASRALPAAAAAPQQPRPMRRAPTCGGTPPAAPLARWGAPRRRDMFPWRACFGLCRPMPRRGGADAPRRAPRRAPPPMPRRGGRTGGPAAASALEDVRHGASAVGRGNGAAQQQGADGGGGGDGAGDGDHFGSSAREKERRGASEWRLPGSQSALSGCEGPTGCTGAFWWLRARGVPSPSATGRGRPRPPRCGCVAAPRRANPGRARCKQRSAALQSKCVL